jgi:hypothetical protein
MRIGWKTWMAPVIASVGLCAGCASSGFFGAKGTTPSDAGLSSTTSAPQTFPSGVNASPLNSESTPGDLYGSMPSQPSVVSKSGGVVLASMRQVGQSISNALRIESKVTPPDDPVKLDNQPANTDKAAVDLHYSAGYFFETQKKFVESAAHYRDALQRCPTDVRSLAGFGRVQEQLGNRAEAELNLRRACELAPQDAMPWNDLAQIYARRHDLNSAMSCLQQAVKLQPTNPNFRNQLARLLIEAGNPDEAVRQLSSTIGDVNAQQQVATWLAQRQHIEIAKSPTPVRLPAE